MRRFSLRRIGAILIKEFLQMRRDPFLNIQPHPVGLLRMRQRMAFDLAQRRILRLVEARRPVAAAVEQRFDLRQIQPFDQHQIGLHQSARRMRLGMTRAGQPPGELAVAAQDGPHAIGHGPTIAAADETARAEKSIGDEIGRPLRPADDFAQELYGAVYSRARCQFNLLASPRPGARGGRRIAL